MVTVEEATRIIVENAAAFSERTTPFSTAAGMTLRENLVADRDFPPFDRVTMDGIAIDFQQYEKGQRHFQIENIAAAGAPQMTLLSPDHCIEVMTGAVLPEHTDTVIRYEDLKIEDGQAVIQQENIRKEQNVHRRGEDRKQGEIIVEAGTILSPAEIGVAATIGKHVLKIAEAPQILILSNGDELIEVTQTPLPHQIRKSNVYSIWSLLAANGIEAQYAHLPDNEEVIREELAKFLDQNDVLILSGGVSEGKFDFIHKALADLGVEKLFHKISQRPGKPFWFGIKKPEKLNAGSKIVFAFPGNPVSSFLCTLRYFLPWFHQSATGKTLKFPTAILTRPVEFKPDLTYFLQVKLKIEDGKILATPVPGHGSGDLSNLVYAEAFLELPKGESVFEAGEVFPIIPFRSIFQ